MDQGTMALLTGLLGTLLGTVIIGGALVGAWLLGRERGRRDLRTWDPGSAQPVSRMEFERLEQSQEVLRAELERLGEEHRFALRVLAERASPSSPASDRDRSDPDARIRTPPGAA